MDAFTTAAAIVVVVGIGLLLMNSSAPSDGSGETTAAPGLIALAQAIARQENVAASANNPGALALGDQGNGVLNSAGVTIFSTFQQGWNALLNELTKVEDGAAKYLNPNMTLAQFAETWTGGDQSAAWAENVASFLGVTTDTTIGQILSGGAQQ